MTAETLEGLRILKAVKPSAMRSLAKRREELDKLLPLLKKMKTVEVRKVLTALLLKVYDGNTRKLAADLLKMKLFGSEQDWTNEEARKLVLLVWTMYSSVFDDDVSLVEQLEG